MSPDELRARLLSRFGPATPAEIAHGLLTVDVGRDRWHDALAYTRDTLDCDFFDWLSAVDEVDATRSAIRVVAHVYSTAHRHHLLLRTLLPGDDAHLPTATTVYTGANWHERETFEMFGVVFDGHPNLIPLLLPPGFAGHPLRKDFVLASRVAKQWPGAVDPGQSLGDLAGKRKRHRAPGVPDPGTWGPTATPAATP